MLRYRVSAGLVAIVSGTVLVLYGSGPADARQSAPLAASTLVNLTVTDVSRVGILPFVGRWGTATTPDTAQESASDPGDLTDPDLVLRHVARPGAALARTTWVSSANQLTAQAQVAGVMIRLGGADLLGYGSVSSDATCGPPQVTPAARITVSGRELLGQPLDTGTTTREITGADLGLATFATGTLTITVATVEETGSPGLASAREEVRVAAVLRDGAGEELFAGQLMMLSLASTQVECLAALPPGRAPSPSRGPSAGPSAAPSPSRASPSRASSAAPSPSWTARPGPRPSRRWPTPGRPTPRWPSHGSWPTHGEWPPPPRQVDPLTPVRVEPSGTALPIGAPPDHPGRRLPTTGMRVIHLIGYGLLLLGLGILGHLAAARRRA